jgi:hypothetical protein
MAGSYGPFGRQRPRGPLRPARARMPPVPLVPWTANFHPRECPGQTSLPIATPLGYCQLKFYSITFQILNREEDIRFAW